MPSLNLRNPPLSKVYLFLDCINKNSISSEHAPANRSISSIDLIRHPFTLIAIPSKPKSPGPPTLIDEINSVSEVKASG